MPVSSLLRRARFGALLLAVAAPVAACNDDSTGPEEEPAIATARVTVGTQTVNVTQNGQSGPVSLRAGVPQTITVEFLRADGSRDPIVYSQPFRLNVEIPSGGGVTFTQAAGNLFAGTIVATQTGTRIVSVQAFHIEEGHEDFAANLTLTVTQ